MLEQIYPYFEYASLILAFFFYKKFKDYTFYKFFVIYLINVVLVGIISKLFFKYNYKSTFDLFNVYTFFEFNLVALIYYNLVKEKINLKVIKLLILIFNIIYFSSYIYVEFKNYTTVLEGVVNSIFIVLYFVELLKSDKVLKYKKLLPFWVSVGFLIFYLTSIPFFTLLYSKLFDNRMMFPILFYLIIVFHLCFIYGLVSCNKKEI